MTTLPRHGVRPPERTTRRLGRAGTSRRAIRMRRGQAIVAHILARNRLEWGAWFLSVMERLGATAWRAVRASGLCGSSFCGSSVNQGFAGGDAGPAEIAGDFLMDVHGMKKR